MSAVYPTFPMNLIHAGSFLTLHYRLAGPDGRDLINTFAEKPATLSLGTGELAPAIEARLIGLEEGVRAQFELAPGEAFGERKPDMLQREVGEDWFLFDFNHPLASQPVSFEVHVIGVI